VGKEEEEEDRRGAGTVYRKGGGKSRGEDREPDQNPYTF